MRSRMAGNLAGKERTFQLRRRKPVLAGKESTVFKFSVASMSGVNLSWRAVPVRTCGEAIGD